MVDVGVALGGVEGRGGDKNGAVAAADEAVVEEEAERRGGSCGAGDLLAGDGILHDLVESWAGFVVVVQAELGLCGSENE